MYEMSNEEKEGEKKLESRDVKLGHERRKEEMLPRNWEERRERRWIRRDERRAHVEEERGKKMY